MARPKLKQEQKAVKFSVSLRPKMYQKLKERAQLYSAGNLSLCIHRLLEDKPVKNNTGIYLTRDDFSLLIREFNKMGSNLNQLAKKQNAGVNVDPQLKEFLPALKKMLDHGFDKIIDKL